MNFRTDINGLRAIALLGVVLFHFLGAVLPGGFSGVDVFFVISGFLMTSIIFRGMEAQTFKIGAFYLARAKRIVPALAVLCGVLVVLGWFFLHPTDFGTLGKHALGSLSFSSNVVYLKESGYFDEASKEKWLLHTWSLSVEWQFYVLYPIALVILRRFMRLQSLRYVLAAGAVASFALCVYATGRWPSSAFYLLPTRAWEMLVGGLAFLYPIQLTSTAKKWTEALGLGAILVAYVAFSEAVAWPGYAAALPVLGTVLVIVAARENSRITGNAVFQWFGAVSYSVYLWHWPLVVWLNYAGKGADLVWVAAGMLLSVGLGALSYYIVENRKRWMLPSSFWTRALGPNLGSVFVVAAIACAVIVYKDGFESRLSPQYLSVTGQQVMPRRDNGYCFYDFNNDTRLVPSKDAIACTLGDRSKRPKVLLFGDSFAGHFEPFWDELGKANGVAINAVTTNWCIPIAGTAFDGPPSHPAYEQCMLNRRMLAAEVANYDLVVFAGQWSNGLKAGYLNEVMQTVRQTAAMVPSVMVMPAPTRYDTNVLKRFQRSLFYQTPFDLGQYTKGGDKQEEEAYASLREDAKDLSNVLFLEREQLFAPSDTYAKSGHTLPYSLDGMHITLEGALVVADAFQKARIYQQVVQPKLALIAHGGNP